MNILYRPLTGAMTVISDQSASIFIEDAVRDGRKIDHPKINKNDGDMIYDEEGEVWVIYPMGPSSFDKAIMFGRDE